MALRQAKSMRIQLRAILAHFAFGCYTATVKLSSLRVTER